MNSHLKTIVIWLVVIAAVVIGYKIFDTASSQRDLIEESDFYRFLARNEVKKITITGDTLEAIAGRPQVGGHQVELEALGQCLGQPHQHLMRIGHPRQLAARAGEQGSGRWTAVVEPLVEELLDAQPNRLQQHDEENAGGEGKEVSQRPEAARVSEEEVVGDGEDESAGDHDQFVPRRVA